MLFRKTAGGGTLLSGSSGRSLRIRARGKDDKKRLCLSRGTTREKTQTEAERTIPKGAGADDATHKLPPKKLIKLRRLRGASVLGRPTKDFGSAY